MKYVSLGGAENPHVLRTKLTKPRDWVPPIKGRRSVEEDDGLSGLGRFVKGKSLLVAGMLMALLASQNDQNANGEACK